MPKKGTKMDKKLKKPRFGNGNGEASAIKWRRFLKPKARPKAKSLLSQFRDAKRSDSKSRVHSSSTSGGGCITALETDCGAEVCPGEIEKG